MTFPTATTNLSNTKLNVKEVVTGHNFRWLALLAIFVWAFIFNGNNTRTEFMEGFNDGMAETSEVETTAGAIAGS